MTTTNSEPENRTGPGQTPGAASSIADLTDFQKKILAVLAEESRYGLAIKRELEDYYDEKVNHGRLYPNLDSLVDKGLVEKSELDKRTNTYELTEDGRKGIRTDTLWVTNHVDHTGPAVGDD